MGQPVSVPALRFERVTVSFDGEPALRDVSFEVPNGETRILFGAAGSGKTVLLKTALGLTKPESGRVFLFGQEITDMPERELLSLRGKAGILFQESALFDSMTIEENVAYPLLNQPAIQCPQEDVTRRVTDALHFVDLDGTLQKFPSELSGGMRRRAAIARAVVTEPPLLLYDSPTAGLDPITANTIITLIVKQRDLGNTTTLIVTHRYKNGDMLANFRYDPDGGGLEQAKEGADGATTRTKFMVFKEGMLIFEGGQAELELSKDPYIAKFVGHNG
ncbi:MAG: ATP-binding cassette domain-containing protein [Bryobacteraceae bacterium]